LIEDTARHRKAAKADKGRRVREISTKKPDPAVKAQQKKVERMKNGAPRNPNGGAYASSHRQPVATRHTAPSTYSGVSSTPLSSRGLHPAGYGNRSSFTQPPNGYGVNRNSNFFQTSNPNSGFFNCGNPTHRARECPVSSAEHRRPEQQSTSPPQPSTQQPPDVRPLKDPEDSDWRIEERAQETEQRPDVHNTGEAIQIVKLHKTPEQGAAPSITKDFTIILVAEGLQKYEGEEPRMWSTAEVAAAAQRDE